MSDTITLTGSSYGSDNITIANGGYSYTNLGAVSGAVGYTISTGGTGSSTFSVGGAGATVSITGGSEWLYKMPEEFVNCMPDFDRIQKMCEEYPALKIALRNFQTIYELVKDDYDSPVPKK